MEDKLAKLKEILRHDEPEILEQENLLELLDQAPDRMTSLGKTLDKIKTQFAAGEYGEQGGDAYGAATEMLGKLGSSFDRLQKDANSLQGMAE